MESDCCAKESLYVQLDRFEQNLDTELNELQGFLHEESNQAQELNDIDDDTYACESERLFFKTEAYCNEVCIIKTTSTRECYGEIAFRDAFYRWGTNCCYQGEVQLDLQHAFDTNFEDIPVILSMLQEQQNAFKPLQCNSENDSSDTDTNRFLGPLHELEKAQSFVISEVSQIDTEKRPIWQVYFELVGDTSNLFRDVIFACSRFFSRGQAFIFLFFEGVLYATVQDHDDLGLLDVDFLAYFTGGNEGSTLAMYNDTTWMKLSAWKRAQRRVEKLSSTQLSISPKPEGLQEPDNASLLLEGLVSDGYVQSYYILKPGKQGREREVTFRFGSWLYQGKVFLSAMNSLQDIPRVIREMRLAQHKLDFVGDVSSYSASNKFVKSMQYSTHITKLMEEEVASCEEYLEIIVDKEGKDWLEDDATVNFFEFTCDYDVSSEEVELELVCNKVYNARGYITISMYHQGRWYLVLEEGGRENPLLDSKFPDLSDRIDGYQLKTYPLGRESWAELRSLSIWQATLNTDLENVPDDKGSSTMPQKVNRKERKHGSLRSLLPLRRKNRPH
ncbi:hypothetical protein ACHAWT_006724 [Skeletonema menzelii]